jgi:hypothetical protein
MKKTMLALGAITLLGGCMGYVDGKAKNGKTTHDMYILHPSITISGYISGS